MTTPATQRRIYFPIRLAEPDPLVIKPVDTVRPDTGIVRTFEPDKITGPYVRVFPCAARPWEILFLQMLRQHDQKFAPANGDGILVLEGALPEEGWN